MEPNTKYREIDLQFVLIVLIFIGKILGKIKGQYDNVPFCNRYQQLNFCIRGVIIHFIFFNPFHAILRGQNSLLIY